MTQSGRTAAQRRGRVATDRCRSADRVRSSITGGTRLRGYLLLEETMRFQIRRVRLALLLVAAAFTAEAQQPTLPKIGYLSASEGHSALDSAFFDALRNLGHVDGKNVIIEARYSAGHPERFPGFAADLVRRDVDVIAAWSPTAVAAAKKATDTIAIVGITLGSDPVSFGWAASLARPNGNVTGSTSGDLLNAKRLEILRETFPPA